MAGFLSNARAIARRCRCPPLKLVLPTVRDCWWLASFPEKWELTLGIETLGHSPDKFTVGLASSSLDLFPRRDGITKSDIRSYGSCEQHGILLR